MEGLNLQVGIRVYQLRIYSNHKSYTHLSGKTGRDVRSEFSKFISKYKKSPLIKISYSENGNEAEKKSHRFVPMGNVMNGHHGLIRYGTFGYGTDVEDVKTGSISHNRTTDEADTIPLYYRIWWPDGYTYGLCAFQSYSGRSCATTIQSEFRQFYRDKFSDWRVESKKIVHDELNEFKAKPVKRITLVKPRTSGNSVIEALRPKASNAEVDISLEVTARGKNSFGRLGDLKDKLSGNMVVEGRDFSHAYATVTVNGKPKKIGVLGVSSNTGVIDVTDAMIFNPDTNMPEPKSISEAAKSETKDFAKKLGK